MARVIWKRLLATLFSALLMLGAGADAVAEADALQAHVVCPEHGELVHVDAVHHHGASVQSVPADDHGFGCHLSELGLPPVVAAVAPALFVPAAIPVPLGTPGSPRAPPVRVAILLLAPKTSPPVV